MLYTRCCVQVQNVWISSVEIIEVLTLYMPIENVLIRTNSLIKTDFI